MKRIVLIAAICCFANFVFAQDMIQPIGVGEKLGDFNLKTLQGETVDTQKLKGEKNIMLIFPRGMVVPNVWCPICYYQYAEMAEMMEKENLKKKFDLEVLYVLPYTQDSVKLWHEAAEKGLTTVYNWKDPKNYKEVNENIQGWINYCKEFFPQEFELKDGKMELPIPVLMDEDKALSRGMALFTQKWGGTEISQNMPTVFIIDKEGKVVFKYHSQYTNDRPTAKYLVEIMEKFL